MTKRMGIAFAIAFLVFFGVETALFVSFLHENNQEIIYLEQQIKYQEQQNISDNTTIELQRQKALREDGLAAFWSFCGTTAFDKVTICLLATVILTAMGGFLKIDSAIEERIRNTKQARINTQKDCIEKTAQMWNDLYSLVSEVRLFNIKRIDEKIKDTEEPVIDNICRRIENFASTAEDTVNTWVFTFPMLRIAGNELQKDAETTEKKIKNGIKTKENLKGEIREIEKQIAKKEQEIKNIEILIIADKEKKVAEKEQEKDKIIGQLKNSNKKLQKEALKLKIVEAYKRKLLIPSKLFLVFINILYNASASTAHFIRNNSQDDNLFDEEKREKYDEIKSMQDSLGIIQDVIKDMAHQKILNILKYSIEPLDKKYPKIESDDNKTIVKRYLKILYHNANFINNLENEFLKMAIMKNKKTRHLKNEVKKLTIWEEQDENYSINTRLNYYDYKKLYESFVNIYDINKSKCINNWELWYDKDYLALLARELYFYSMTMNSLEKATWWDKELHEKIIKLIPKKS